MNLRRIGILAVTTILLAAGCGGNNSASGIHKIKHVVIIMQENRSFDNYFGAYPGADGVLTSAGKPKMCIPDPGKHTCASRTSITPT